jgi:outer membrane protein TolC
LSDTLARTPAGVAVEAGSLARERRPELRAELARLRAAELAVSAIAAERWPRLELTADYGLNGLTVPDAIATRQVAVQLSLPLLDGFRREGRIDEQRALLAEAAIRQRELERAIDAEVELAALEVKSAAAQAGIAAERRRLAEEELRQARERFAAGVVGNIEVITAQVSLLAARDAEIESRFAAALARVALAAATGTVRELR